MSFPYPQQRITGALPLAFKREIAALARMARETMAAIE
jgi:hypothetical protein